MMKYKRLSLSIAAIAVCCASASVANATAITLTATDILQSYTTLAKDTITFDFATVVPADLIYARYVGTFEVDGNTVGAFGSADSYLTPGFTNAGVTFEYKLIPAVPETVTWAMMLIGLGAIGAGARRRQATGVSYA